MQARLAQAQQQQQQQQQQHNGPQTGGAANIAALGDLARSTAQQLVDQWSLQPRSPLRHSSDESPTRGKNYNEQVAERGGALRDVFIPPQWDALMSASIRGVAPSNKRHIMFTTDGGCAQWDVDPAVDQSVEADTRRCASPPSTSSSLNAEGSHQQQGPSPGSSSTQKDQSNQYGLSEEELQYFGMLPQSNVTSERNHPKYALVEALKNNRTNMLPTQKKSTPLPVSSSTNSNGTGGVVIRSTTCVVSSEDDTGDASPEATSSPQSVAQRRRGETFLKQAEKPINLRFLRPGCCDATGVLSCIHLLAISKAVMSKKAAKLAERSLDSVIVHIDLSRTKLGKQGRFVVPTSFTPDGAPKWFPRRTADDGPFFWPDEGQILTVKANGKPRHSSEEIDQVLRMVGERSLSLAYIAPALYLKSPEMFSVKSLVAVDCDLTDEDAQALAIILRAPHSNTANSTNYECVLERVDLSRNSITDQGADYLKKALKYNTTMKELILKDNPITNTDGVLNEIKRRLRRNRVASHGGGLFGSLLS